MDAQVCRGQVPITQMETGVRMERMETMMRELKSRNPKANVCVIFYTRHGTLARSPPVCVGDPEYAKAWARFAVLEFPTYASWSFAASMFQCRQNGLKRT